MMNELFLFLSVQESNVVTNSQFLVLLECCTSALCLQNFVIAVFHCLVHSECQC